MVHASLLWLLRINALTSKYKRKRLWKHYRIPEMAAVDGPRLAGWPALTDSQRGVRTYWHHAAGGVMLMIDLSPDERFWR
jgi:hypothetical protein